MAKKSSDKEVKLNLLSVNRRSKHVVGCMVPDKDYVFISSDLASGEPTFMLNYTDDATLKAILLEFRGKRPEWRDGLLLTDSLYISTMSRTSLIRDALKELERRGIDFAELYYKDSEEAKKALGNSYKIAKMLVLALLYGLGVSKLVIQARDNGLIITKEYAREIHTSFWDSIGKAKEFRDMLVILFTKANKEGRPFVSPFGLPIPTGKPHDAFNYCIQSSVSAYLRMLTQKVFPCNFCRLACIIHDEVVVECKRGYESEWKDRLFSANRELNDELGMRYPLQLGFQVGEDFYAIH
jgi:hypothetical protein